MTVLAAYGGIFMLVISVIAVGYQPPQPTAAGTAVANAATQTPVATPNTLKPSVDELVATDVAGNLAEQTNMAVSPYIASMSVSLAAKADLAQTDSDAIVKPEIVQLTATNTDITTYIVQKGETLESIAAKFNITVQTLRWANDMTSNSVSVGKKLVVPPVDGVIYTVRQGDTLNSLASTYKASKERIVSVNNLEISGLQPGMKIVIPDGNLPANQRPGYVAPQPAVQTTTSVSYGTGFGGTSWRIKIGTPGLANNGYAYGNCTRYAYDRRIELGLPVGNNWGNAATWSYYAQRAGLRVDNTPSVGAVIQNGGGFGHVGIVEKIRANGDIEISEMNAYVSGGGWNIVDGRVIPASQVGYYSYIH